VAGEREFGANALAVVVLDLPRGIEPGVAAVRLNAYPVGAGCVFKRAAVAAEGLIATTRADEVAHATNSPTEFGPIPRAVHWAELAERVRRFR
jgi:hypothetical protein